MVSQLIEKHISQFLAKKYSPPPDGDTAVTQKLYFSLPYFGYQSEKLSKELTVLLHKFIPDVQFNIILSNNFRIGSFFNYKDKLPKAMQSSLVYKFSCVRCTSEYIGSTSRVLHVRVAEHAGRSSRSGRPLAVPPHSNIREHQQTCDSPIALDNFSILNSYSNQNDLRILESLYIFKLKPSLNSMQSSTPSQ